jgi:cold-inducible RNA-binding protein
VSLFLFINKRKEENFSGPKKRFLIFLVSLMDNNSNSKLFVGGIAWATTEEGLKEFFSAAGTVVEVKVIIDRRTGKSKGFGFVTMSSEEEAEKAVAELDGKELDGRSLKIDRARPMEERPQR